MSRKRKHTYSLRSRKKSKHVDPSTGTIYKLELKNDDGIDWNEWVAATATKNYVLEDGILDLLKYRSSVVTKHNPNYQQGIMDMIDFKTDNFTTSIMKQGKKFERKVMELLMKKFGKKKVYNIGGDTNPRSDLKYHNTLKVMKKGYPIIYQAVLRNYSNRTYGVADLLIRSDYLSKVIKTPYIKPGRKKYYVVIDIKFKTLQLKADGIHLRNDGILKPYKAQLCIYNQALGEMQGYEPDSAYILGWKWKYTSQTIEYSGSNCFEKLGKIDYKGIDQDYIDKTLEAVEWVRTVRSEAKKWDMSKLPLPHPQLYPNMCNKYDYPYHKIKKQLAEDLDEITLVWRCSTKHRKAAHSKGIYKWSDPRCNTSVMEIGGDYTTKIVSRILEANQTSGSLVVPNVIENNWGDWKTEKHIEFFVDFETTCSVFNEFEKLPEATGESLIFIIGVGYVCPETDQWIFQDFTVKSLDKSGQQNICVEFVNYLEQVCSYHQTDLELSPLYHWSHAEPTSWRKAVDKVELHWVDLLKVFQVEPIGVKSCLNYSLKTIAKSFYKHGLIETVWKEGGKCVDGADAAVGAYHISKNCEALGIDFDENPLVKDIVQYNEIDCKVLSEILNYLRTNHVEWPEDISSEY